MNEKKRIAIIGAGPSGLTAIKSCKEEGFIPVCYERSSELGGLWRYHEEDLEGVASVMRTTIINTSKERSAFSDFPPPKEFPNYMHNRKMLRYFTMYAEHFDLLRHIRYNLEVTKVEMVDNDSGRWTVSVKSTKTDAITKETFDAVMVCVGHHVFPNIPSFKGQEKFKGTVTHTHSLKSCDQFKGKRVVVVGIGNSGVDAAIDATYVAEQVYLSTRRGSWILSRVSENGLPQDILTCRKKFYFNSFKSFDKVNDEIEEKLDTKFNHAAYNVKPKHRFLSAHPTVNDNLPNAILSGRVIIKGDIERFEENGILFQLEDEVTEIDAVILATGYHIKFPFLDGNVLKIEDNRVHLYKYSIPPNLKHKTLVFVGLVQPLGALFPISEMQCRWFMQILSGKLKLPSVQEMEKDIALKNAANSKRYVTSPRHTIQVDFLPFMDELAEMIGAKPNFWKMAITDPKLFWACINGPVVSYQYRLVGPHPWSGARAAILSVHERVMTPLNNNKTEIVIKKKSLITYRRMLFSVAVIVMGAIVRRNYRSIMNILQLMKYLLQVFLYEFRQTSNHP